MLQEPTIEELFPSPVWIVKLNAADVERLSSPLMAKIERLREATGTIKQGVSWQTRNDLQEDPDLEDLKVVIREATTQVLNSLEIEYDSFLITGLWANIQSLGGKHPSHSHPNNYLSGVYYLRVPEGENTLMFNDPRHQIQAMNPRVKRKNRMNSHRAHVTVETGSLVLFPSWLVHSVKPNESLENRISISFNIMFENFGETMSKPLWDAGGPA
jgi:uncharacterized protein (TIGR02466 family)